MTNYCCVDHQLHNWHFRTVCRYTLMETPILKPSKTLGNLVNNVLPNISVSVNSKINNYAFRGRLKFAEKSQYNLAFNSIKSISKISLNHIQLWNNVKKIGFHITSGKLLYNMELYASFYIVCCCCGQQSPKTIRSKQSVAGFNVIKSAVTGVQNTLRNKNKLYFAYKWAYLSGGLPFEEYSNVEPTRKVFSIKKKKIKDWGRCFGITNVFILPELDKFNYDLFEPVIGFDVAFYFNCSLKKKNSLKKLINNDNIY